MKLDATRTPGDGSSETPHREATRVIAVAQQYAGAAYDMLPNGTSPNAVRTDAWLGATQRRLGLHLSNLKPVLQQLREAGPEYNNIDFHGDQLGNHANHNRRHNACNNRWYDAAAAVAIGATVLGDKEHGKEQRTKQFNDGHVPDLVEVGAGPIGQDIVNETKVFADLKKNTKKGCKGRDGSGTIRHDGHRYGFGNSEDDARVANLGCKQRGVRGDHPYNHNTGKGYYKGIKGLYHDALVNKKNQVNINLHNTFGGFCRAGAAKIRRMGRRAKGGIDRTRYAGMGRNKLSYVRHHTQMIGSGIIKNDAYAINDAVRYLKGKLLDQRSAPTFGDFLPTHNNPAAGAAAF